MKNNFYSKYIEWDVSNWSRALEYLDENKCMPFKGKNILELGGKNASLSLWAAEKGGLVTCSDIVGLENHFSKKFNHIKNDSIRYEIIDALDIGLKETYDFILFKSMLGGIGRIGSEKLQMDVMRQVHKSLRKGGQVLFIENMMGTWFHQYFRNRYGAGKNYWSYPTLKKFGEFSKLFDKISYRTFGYIGGSDLPLKKIRSKLDIYLEQIIHPTCHYIYAGIYQK